MTDGRPTGPDPASLLRHDLITPINQILGYSDLMIDEADLRGRSYTSQSLQSIRSMARQALRAIDAALIPAPKPGPPGPPDLDGLAAAVGRQSDAILEACRALEETSANDPDRERFLEDLARVRDAAVLLAEIARRASAGEAS